MISNVVLSFCFLHRLFCVEWFTDENEAVFRGFLPFTPVVECLYGKKRSEIVFFDASTFLKQSGARKTVQTPSKAKNDRFPRQISKIVVRSYQSLKSCGWWFLFIGWTVSGLQIASTSENHPPNPKWTRQSTNQAYFHSKTEQLL